MSELDDLRSVLAQHAPFDSVSAEVRDGLVAKAEIMTYAAGSLVLNAFEDPSSAVYVVLDGQVVHAGGVPPRSKVESWL